MGGRGRRAGGRRGCCHVAGEQRQGQGVSVGCACSSSPGSAGAQLQQQQQQRSTWRCVPCMGQLPQHQYCHKQHQQQHMDAPGSCPVIVSSAWVAKQQQQTAPGGSCPILHLIRTWVSCHELHACVCLFVLCCAPCCADPRAHLLLSCRQAGLAPSQRRLLGLPPTPPPRYSTAAGSVYG